MNERQQIELTLGDVRVELRQIFEHEAAVEAPRQREFRLHETSDLLRGVAVPTSLVVTVSRVGRVDVNVLVHVGRFFGLDERLVARIGERLFVALADRVAAFALDSLELLWSQCASADGLEFPVFALVALDDDALVVHSELEISRWSTNGLRVWSVDGADIFTGTLVVGPKSATVTDWNDDLYTIDLATGATQYERRH